MAKFRAKSPEVEAVRFVGPIIPQAVGIYFERVRGGALVEVLAVETPDGTARIAYGDWIVTDAEGLHRVYKPKDFEAIYEPVEG